MRTEMSLIRRNVFRNSKLRRAVFVAFVFALLGAVSVVAGQDSTWLAHNTVIAELAHSNAATNPDSAASHACIIHAACVVSFVQVSESQIAHEHSSTVGLPSDASSGSGRATLPLIRPPISVATI